MIQSDQTRLTSEVATWIDRAGLAPADSTTERYLSHGYTELASKVWPDATHDRLLLTAKWMVWMWLADDMFDATLIHLPVAAANMFTIDCTRAISGRAPLNDVQQALVPALYDLAAETRDRTSPAWWKRYRGRMIGWLNSACENHEVYDRLHSTPTVAEHLAARHLDGGMYVAAEWIVLAESLTVPEDDRQTLRVQDLLVRFSNVGCWTNDLVDARSWRTGRGRSLLSAMVAAGSDADDAEHYVRTLLAAEVTTLRFFADVLSRDRSYHPDTRRWALGLIRFADELRSWTARSSRYEN